MNVSYTSGIGETVVFGKPTFRLISIGGLGDVEADNQNQKAPYQDGSSYIDSYLEERVIPMEIKIYGKDPEDVSLKRQELSRIFNPKLGPGTFKIDIGNREYKISAVSDFVPVFAPGAENMGSFFQYCQVQVTAHNPYWRSPNETTKPLVAYEGGFTLPFTLPFTLGRSGSKTVLYNDGDVPAPMRIEIHGPTTNPQIFNRTTGEHIRINRTVAEGEVMHINTESGRQRITVTDENGNESNAFGYLDSESSILSQFNLELGENEIEHVADAGNRHAEVIVRWDDLYVGV